MVRKEKNFNLLFCNYLHLVKDASNHLNKDDIPLTKIAVCQSVSNCLVLENPSSLILLLLHNCFPMERVMALHLNEL